MRLRATVAAAGAAIVVLAGCGDGDEESPAPRAVTVNIASFKFLPEEIEVARGGTVTWRNQDKAPHNAVEDHPQAERAFETVPRLDQGDSDAVRIDTPGTYTYYCRYHRFMTAKITVR